MKEFRVAMVWYGDPETRRDASVDKSRLNVSAVYPIPPSSLEPLAREVKRRLLAVTEAERP